MKKQVRQNPLLANIITFLLFMFFLVIISIGSAEILMRALKPDFGESFQRELRQFRKNPDPNLAKKYEIDPVFGFRPILGGTQYNRYGTLTNRYDINDRDGRIRVLFLGDSVTARAKITDALQRLCGNDRYEYWNAGVESFNTVQEVNFYKKYNAPIKPDRVVLFFHNNDFETTPVAFRNKENRLVVYAPEAPAFFLNRRLFQKSYLYRAFCSVFMKTLFRYDLKKPYLNPGVVKETEKSLQELECLLANDDIRLTVVVLPIFEPYPSWHSYEIESRNAVLKILQELHIHAIDLLPAVRGSSPDRWHPNDQTAEACAKLLLAEKIF
jgi:hypothetical protein